MRNWIIGTIAAAGLVLGSSAATGATLTAVLSSNSANPGDVVTLTLSGDPQGASAGSILIALTTSAGSFVNAALQPDQSAWNVLNPQSCAATSCSIADGFSFGATAGVASAYGTVDIDTAGLAPGSQVVLTLTGNPNLIYFGLNTDQPAGVINIVPEPGTAAMMGLGMLGLAFAGRHRK